MILATRHGNREHRGIMFAPGSPDFSHAGRIPRAGEEGASYAGRPVTFAAAVGLPAVFRGFRLISEAIGGMPMQVVRDDGTGRQEAVRDAPQWPLLHDFPNPGPPAQTAMSVWSFAVVCLLLGGVVLQKLRAGGELIGLEPIPPGRYGGKPVWDDGELVVKIRGRDGSTRLVVGEDVLYIPGVLLDDPYIGVGVIEVMRHALGNPLARQEYEGRYLLNDGGLNIVLRHPGEQTPQQRGDIRQGFEGRHTGPRNAGRPALMWGGWELDKLGLTLADAQFVETQQFTVQDVGRMLGIPPGKLAADLGAQRLDPAKEDPDFLKWGLAPWMNRLQQGLHADDDLFPTKLLEPRLLPEGLLRADIRTRNEAHLKARQAGWKSPNEIRRDEGLPPVDGGEDIQMTPVGGAPNPDRDPDARPDPDEQE